jgi:hypothetical protein
LKNFFAFSLARKVIKNDMGGNYRHHQHHRHHRDSMTSKKSEIEMDAGAPWYWIPAIHAIPHPTHTIPLPKPEEDHDQKTNPTSNPSPSQGSKAPERPYLGNG